MLKAKLRVPLRLYRLWLKERKRLVLPLLQGITLWFKGILSNQDLQPNPIIYSLPPSFVPLPERTHVPPHVHNSRVADGFVAQGALIFNQMPIPRTNEELKDKFEMQNYNGATLVVIPTTARDSEAILMCHALT